MLDRCCGGGLGFVREPHPAVAAVVILLLAQDLQLLPVLTPVRGFVKVHDESDVADGLAVDKPPLICHFSGHEARATRPIVTGADASRTPLLAVVHRQLDRARCGQSADRGRGSGTVGVPAQGGIKPPSPRPTKAGAFDYCGRITGPDNTR